MTLLSLNYWQFEILYLSRKEEKCGRTIRVHAS